MKQSWRDLLFAHWPVPASTLRARIPDALEIDTYGGTAWIGLVPFRMTGVTGRGMPGVPGISNFEELNVRTYVTIGGKPGVWFFSLDAAHRLAVWTARRFFHLPYFLADMALDDDGGSIRYQSRRRGGDARFLARYLPTGGVLPPARPGMFDHWLTERYCLYCQTPSGGIRRGEVHHRPWSLQPAELEVTENSVLDGFAIDAGEPPYCLHFSRRIDVILWALGTVD